MNITTSLASPSGYIQRFILGCFHRGGFVQHRTLCGLATLSHENGAPFLKRDRIKKYDLRRKNGWLPSTTRTYLHFRPIRPEDWELPEETMPENISEVLRQDPRQLDFFENYWYWKIRSEATLLNPNSLPKKSYRQLIFDMGMQTVSEKSEHLVGLLELYEYLTLAPCVGPFGTVESPVVIPSVSNERIVACTGGTGDNEHVEVFFRLREGFLYRCGECDQIFMLARVLYTLPEGVDPFPVDPDIDDVFDNGLLEKGQRMWNSGEYIYWPSGNLAYKRAFMDGAFGNEVPSLDGFTIGQIESAEDVPRLTMA